VHFYQWGSESEVLDKKLIDCAEELAQKEFIVFAGSGIDLRYGMPSWKSLLENLYNTAKKEGFTEYIEIENQETEEYPKVAQKIYDFFKSKGLEKKYYEKIKEFLTPNEVPYDTKHLEIVKTSNWIITTNFTDFFEKAFKSKLEDKSDININIQSLPEFKHENCFHTPTIVYLHGKADEQYIIFKENDYKKYYPSVYNNDGAIYIEDYLKYIYQNYTIVFVGFGFEYSIREIFVKIYKEIEKSDEIASEKPGYMPKLNSIKHYCFLKINENDENEYKKQIELIKILKSIKIEVIKINEYIEWIEVFQKIRELKRANTPTSLEVADEI